MNGLDLKIERIKAHVTQANVAALLGVSQAVLYEIESGKRTVTDAEANAIVKAIELASSGRSAAVIPLDGGGELR